MPQAVDRDARREVEVLLPLRIGERRSQALHEDQAVLRADPGRRPVRGQRHLRHAAVVRGAAGGGRQRASTSCAAAGEQHELLVLVMMTRRLMTNFPHDVCLLLCGDCMYA